MAAVCFSRLTKAQMLFLQDLVMDCLKNKQPIMLHLQFVKELCPVGNLQNSTNKNIFFFLNTKASSSDSLCLWFWKKSPAG